MTTLMMMVVVMGEMVGFRPGQVRDEVVPECLILSYTNQFIRTDWSKDHSVRCRQGDQQLIISHLVMDTIINYSTCNINRGTARPSTSINLDDDGRSKVHLVHHQKYHQQQGESSKPVKMAAVAARDIQAGVISGPIRATCPLDVSTVFWNDADIDYVVEVIVENDRMLSTALPHAWMNHVRLARHCHVQNLQIVYCTADGNFYLQATRRICQGELLYAWFSIETTKLFRVPFLSLKNIQGGHQYVCHRCSAVFEDPNPLKIHLAFLCTPGPSGVFALPLAEVAVFPGMELPASRTFPSTIRPTEESETASLSAFRSLQEKTSSSPTGFVDVSPTQAGSVPKPGASHFVRQPPELPFGLSIWNGGPSTALMMSYHYPRFVHTINNNLSTSDCSSAVGPIQSLSVPSSPMALSHGAAPPSTTAAAELPKMASGKPKRRHHQCLYCGKLYSRKYGLKIHIRTHTGYKPLKCKVCFRPFGDPSNLNKHIRLHAQGITPYRCHLCGKVLVRRRDLERHLRSRHPSGEDEKSSSSSQKNVETVDASAMDTDTSK